MHNFSLLEYWMPKNCAMQKSISNFCSFQWTLLTAWSDCWCTYTITRSTFPALLSFHTLDNLSYNLIGKFFYYLNEFCYSRYWDQKHTHTHIYIYLSNGNFGYWINNKRAKKNLRFLRYLKSDKYSRQVPIQHSSILEWFLSYIFKRVFEYLGKLKLVLNLGIFDLRKGCESCEGLPFSNPIYDAFLFVFPFVLNRMKIVTGFFFRLEI